MLEVRLLGRFEVRRNGKLVDIPSRPAQSLLAYLVLNTGMQHRRAKLAGLLWPDSDETNAKSNLRHALWRLRKALGEEYFFTDKFSIGFVPTANYQLDVSSLEIESAKATSDDLDRIVSAYDGELLPGFYDDWVALERERLQAVFNDRMQLLLDKLVAEGRWRKVRASAERWIALGQVPEPAYRALMVAHSELGDLTGMAAAYQRCVEALREELGVEPSAETQTLYKQLSRGDRAPAGTAPARERAPAPQVHGVPIQLPAFLEAEGEPSEPPREAFVGRERELARLAAFLENVSTGRGQLTFVTGEAGRGKTTLVDEFARRAQRDHADLIVAKGICNVYTGVGDPYLPFRDVMGMLTGDVEALWAAGAITRDHARRLWSLLPEVVQALVDRGPHLIDSFVAGAGLLSRAAAFTTDGVNWLAQLQHLAAQKAALAEGQGPDQSRIFEEYTDVLTAVAASRPLMLILDDLHWADVSSVSLLFHLSRRIRQSRILIVGAYRPEDVAQQQAGERHPLPGVLSEFKRHFGDVWVDLDPEREADGRGFVDAILDTQPNKLGERFRQELTRHTAGHPLFTVELLRDMQERGDLVQDKHGRYVEGPNLSWNSLPARVEGVIEKRIGRLDPTLRAALTVASVEGEVFTAEVVARVEGADEQGLARRLSGELERQHRLVVEQSVQRLGARQLSRYRFRHNLFQKYLYQSLGHVERTYLHEAVGKELESLYGAQADDVAVQLARHFQEAGATAKAIPYLEKAGEHALKNNANQEAIRVLAEALALVAQQPATGARRRADPAGALQRARLRRLLGDGHYGLGQLPESGEHFKQALTLLGWPVPETPAKLGAGLVGQLVRQAMFRLLLARIRAKRSVMDEQRKFRLTEAFRAYERLAEVFFLHNDLPRTIYATLISLNLAEGLGPSAELARGYASVCVAAGLVPLHGLARHYKRQAQRIAQDVNDLPALGEVFMLGSLYDIGVGQWGPAEATLTKALELFEQLGHLNRWGICVQLLAATAYHQGRFARNADLAAKLHESAHRRNDAVHQAWGLLGQVESLLPMGEPHTALTQAERAVALLAQSDDLTTQIRAYGLLAAARFRHGQPQAAQQAADQAAALSAKSPPTSFGSFPGYAGTAETYLSLWEAGAADERVKRQAGKACQALRSYARVFPIGRPRAHIYQGWYDWLTGRSRPAHRAWQQGLAAAGRLAMAYDEGLAHYEIGRHLPAGDPRRSESLSRAVDCFANCEATFDLARARAALENSAP